MNPTIIRSHFHREMRSGAVYSPPVNTNESKEIPKDLAELRQQKADESRLRDEAIQQEQVDKKASEVLSKVAIAQRTFLAADGTDLDANPKKGEVLAVGLDDRDQKDWDGVTGRIDGSLSLDESGDVKSMYAEEFYRGRGSGVSGVRKLREGVTEYVRSKAEGNAGSLRMGSVESVIVDSNSGTMTYLETPPLNSLANEATLFHSINPDAQRSPVKNPKGFG